MFRKMFGARLRMARKRKGLSTKQMAEKLHLSDADYFRRYERGERLPSPEMILDLCELLEITPNFLYIDSLERLQAQVDWQSKMELLTTQNQEILTVLYDKLLSTQQEDTGADREEIL